MGEKRKPESDQLEYKSDMTRSFLKTVSAYANFNGGMIEFGINDDRTVKGLANPLQFAEALTNSLNDNIKPVPDYEIAINDRDKTVLLTVRPGTQTPYFYNGKAYQRRNASTIETGTLTLQDLILQGRNLSFDALPAGRQDLTFDTLGRAAQSLMGVEKLGSDTLISLGLSGKNGYSRAAELLSDHNEYPVIDVAVFGDNLNTIRKREATEHTSILAQYERILEIYRDNYQKEVIEGTVRQSVEEIPETAVREALANALIHRNWAINANIQVHMFSDHMEVRSPGGLPDGVSEKAYLSDTISRARNPQLAYVFLRLNLIERLGTGVRRIREAYAGSDRTPAFQVTESSITVFLPVKNRKPRMTQEQASLYELMNPNILYSRKDLEDLTGFGRSRIMRLIGEMSENGLLKIQGVGKSRKYSRI